MVRLSIESWFKLVSCLPDLKETDSRVEPVRMKFGHCFGLKGVKKTNSPIKDGQWHRDVCQDGPCPYPEDLQMSRSKLRTLFNEAVKDPH